MTQKQIDELYDALIKLSESVEKAISLLVKALPGKDIYSGLREDKDNGRTK